MPYRNEDGGARETERERGRLATLWWMDRGSCSIGERCWLVSLSVGTRSETRR